MTGVSIGCMEWADISEWLAWWLAEPKLGQEEQEVFDRYYHSYKRRFTPYLRHHYARQSLEVQALIEKGARVLEVGCGCGTESLWFAIMGASVVGVDLNEPRLAVARARAEFLRKNLGATVDAEFLKSSFFELDLAATFDVVWMEQAFHHLEPRAQVPDALRRLLKPGGYVVISEENGWNPALQLALFRERGVKTVREYIDVSGKSHLYGVERITTAGSILRQFMDCGFKPVAKEYFRVLPNVAIADQLSWVERLAPAWLLPAFTHYNVVLQKL